MIEAKSYAVHNAKDKLGLCNFERREVGADDIIIDSLY